MAMTMMMTMTISNNDDDDADVTKGRYPKAVVLGSRYLMTATTEMSPHPCLKKCTCSAPIHCPCTVCNMQSTMLCTVHVLPCASTSHTELSSTGLSHLVDSMYYTDARKNQILLR